MKKHSLICIFISALFLSPTSQANQSMKEFFADEKIKKGFDATVQSGKMKIMRTQIVDSCLAGAKKEIATETDTEKKKEMELKAQTMCDCFNEKLNTISDEEFFYESMTAYQRYQARFQAAKEKDMEKLEKLRKEHAKIDDLGKKLTKACGTI